MFPHTIPGHTCITALVLFLLIFGVTVPGCLQQTPASAPPGKESATPSPIQTRYAPGDIPRLSADAEQKANASFNAIAALPPAARTFDNTVLAYDSAMTSYTDALYPLILMGYVYPDPQVAAEGMAAEASATIFLNDVTTRRGLYDALSGQVPRKPAESRLYNVTIRQFEKNGLSLPEDRLVKVREMKTELSGLESQFSANLNNDNTTLVFTEADLAGIPSDSLATFEKTPEGAYRVTMKSPDYSAVMKNADRSRTRETMYKAYNNRQAEENTRLLEQAILLRQSIARELGYPTWADYRISGRMAGNASRVMAFLTSVKGPVQEKNRAADAELLAIKKELDPSATALDPWDVTYLQQKLILSKYSYDQNEVREYYPVDRVLDGMFTIFSNLYGIGFEEVNDTPAWSVDVRLYRIRNLSDGATLGYLYLDLYPRDGKYSHFATFPVTNERITDGVRSVPVTAIVGNFPAPSGDRPGLLSMYDIETLFHESGHALHYLLTTAPYGTLSGFNTELDFVETPSQAMEEWVWDPEMLTSLSGHYTNASRKIPDDLRDRVIAARDVDAASTYGRIMANSMEDMEYHTADGPVDTRQVSARIYEEMTGIPQPPEIHQPASFGHIMGQYDAGYYGYLWSKVYALEVAEAFRQDGMMNRTRGMQYRAEILSQGNMEDGMTLLKNFLGTEPGTGAFNKRLGIRQ